MIASEFNTILKDQLIYSVSDLDVIVCQVISFIRSNSVGVEAKVSLTHSDFSVLDSILELIVPGIDVSIKTASLISEKGSVITPMLMGEGILYLGRGEGSLSVSAVKMEVKYLFSRVNSFWRSLNLFSSIINSEVFNTAPCMVFAGKSISKLIWVTLALIGKPKVEILVKDCDYPTATVDDMVRNLIVCWTLSTEIREILLSEGGTLGLSKAIEIARAHETTQAQLSTMGDVSKDMKFKQEIGALQKTNV
ncbi:hypothetical protein QYM36_014650, partial [Artemia franciscana]